MDKEFKFREDKFQYHLMRLNDNETIYPNI